jgi:MFS family permease
MNRSGSTARHHDASSSLVVLIVSSGFALASLDLFVVNVALPKIAHDFGSAGLGDLSWVLNAYAIVYAALLVVFVRLADCFPREYGFLLGIAGSPSARRCAPRRPARLCWSPSASSRRPAPR